ncbi:PAS domain S-box-containing protein [Methanolinea mesophila]|uniref:PAS domain S-box protein n=1 Tax=Methanolinea mesophila TaxID=547055 RepID=UPI001AE64C12|nr:PAS domain S-box protein [Methanolinea mesophila]MBP1929964.1 PAS domain S-box-containing protein [Methanolinea mesophila]
MDPGEETSAALLKALKFSPRGLSITDIAKKTGRDRNSVAKYLDVLRAEGKVEVRTIGSARVYSLAHRVPLSAFLCFTRNDILIVDRELNIVQANDKYLSLAGYAKEELIGRNLLDLNLPVVSTPEAVAILGSVGKEQIVTEIHSTTGRQELFYRMEVIPTTFEAGETGLTIILEDITEKNRHLKNMEFLARTAMELVDISPDTDIFEYIEERITELLPEHPRCFIESFDETRGVFVMRAIVSQEFRQDATTINEGKDLIGITIDLHNFFSRAPFFESPSTMKEFRELRFRPFFEDETVSFYDACAHIFPKDVCDRFLRRYGIGKMALIGLTWQNQLFGVVGICLSPDEVLENRQAIESFLRQVSIAFSRRMTEERLSRSEKRFEDLITLSDHALFMTDQAGKIRLVNRRFTEILGYSREDIPNLGAWCEKAFRDPVSREEFMSMVTGHPRPGDVRNGPLTVRCGNGTGKNILFHTTVLPDGSRVIRCDECPPDAPQSPRDPGP